MAKGWLLIRKKMQLLFSLLLILPALAASGETSEITARAGDTIQLLCPVDTSECGEFHSLEWYRDSERVFVYGPNAGFENAEDGLMDRCFDPTHADLGAACPRGSLEADNDTVVLTISPIQLTDEGQYRCEITYLDISLGCPLVHATKVRTIAAPTHQRLSLSNDEEALSGNVVGPYPAGSQASFSCESSGKPAPTLFWMFDGMEVEGETVEEGGQTKSTVTLNLERKHLGSVLLCKVLHEALDEELAAELEIDINVPIETVELDYSSLEGREWEEMEVVCMSKGSRPAATITWTLPNLVEYTAEQEAHLLEDSTYNTVSRIRFTPIANDDGMSVTCHAVNEVMEDGIETSEEINILFAPQVSVDEEGQSVVAGEDVTMDCQYEANPANLTHLDWLKNGVVVEGERFNVEDTTLTITNAHREDAGDYRCRAANSVGEGLSEGRHPLVVFYPPHVEVTMSPWGPVSEEEDEKVELLCTTIDGSPTVLSRVKWFKDGELLKEQPHPILCPTGRVGQDEIELDLCKTDPAILSIQPVTREDMGHYACSGINIAGEGPVSEEIFLDVLYLPSVGEISVEGEAVKEGRVELVCPLDNPGHPEATQFLWMKGDEELAETSSNFSLTDLALQQQANYSCAALNSLGVSDFVSIELMIAAPPKFLIMPPEEANLVEGTETSLHCQVECAPMCELEWVVEGQVITGEEEQFTVDMEELDEDGDQFTSVFTTLTMLPQENKHKQLSATCRVKSYGNNFTVDLSSSSTITIEYAPGTPELVLEDEALKGEDVQLTCFLEERGNPDADHFVWTKDGVILEDTSYFLLLPSIGPADEGNYSCSAVNSIGKGPSDSLHLDIAAPPAFLVELPEKTTVEVGGEISFVCHVECSPLCGLEWLVDGKSVQGKQGVGGDRWDQPEQWDLGDQWDRGERWDRGEDFVVDLDELDADVEIGQFTSVTSTLTWLNPNLEKTEFLVECRGGIGWQDQHTVTSSTLVVIEHLPGRPQILPNGPTMKGGNIDLLCNLEDPGHPEASHFVWKKDGSELEESTANLTLTSLSPVHEGNYSCAAINSLGLGEEDSFQLEVTAPPKFLMRLPEKTTLVSGEELTFQCQVECSPLCGITWVVGEEELTGDSDLYTIKEMAVKQSDDQFSFVESTLALYEAANNLTQFSVSCRVSHDHLVEQTVLEENLFTEIEPVRDSFIESLTLVTVEYLPKSPELNQEEPAIKGDQLTLNCLLEDPGYPEATEFIWRKDGEELAEISANLSFPSVGLEEEGSYSCAGVNYLGTGEFSTVIIDVIAPPKLLSGLDSESMIALGDEAMLECQVECSPLCSISWLVNDEPVEDVGGFLVEEQVVEKDRQRNQFASITSTLAWQQLEKQKEDFNIACRINTEDMMSGLDWAVEFEDITSSSSIAVNYPPEQAQISQEDEASKGGSVELTCGLEDAGHPEAEEFIWKKDGEELAEISSSLNLTQLGLSDEGNYSCAGVNSQGNGESDYLFVEVSAPPRFLKSLPEMTTLVEGEDIEFQCQVECSPLCSISWVVGEEEVEDLEEKRCQVDVEEVEEILEENQFSSVLSTLTCSSTNLKNFSVSCSVRGGKLAEVGSSDELEEELFADTSANQEALDHTISSHTVVTVEYLPGTPDLQLEGETRKDESVILSCALNDAGHPRASHFVWERDGVELDETSSSLTLPSLGLTDEGTYSCMGVNTLGVGLLDSLQIEVTAGPTILDSPEKETAAVVGYETSLTCQLECSPLCGLQWLVDGQLVDEEEKYTVEEEIVEQEEEINQFTGVKSTLTWHQLERTDEETIITCRSAPASTEEGAEEEENVTAESSTIIRVEYAPLAVDLSEELVEIEEGSEVENLECFSDARPAASLVWTKEGEEIATGTELTFSTPISRDEAGRYKCQAENVHGKAEAELTVDVLYRPSCSVSQELQEEEMILTCSAVANPEDAVFYWSKDDVTFSGQGEGMESRVRLRLTNETTGTYYCHVNNTVGEDTCHLEITEMMMTAGISTMDLYIILIVVLVVVVIFLLVLACYFFHRKHAARQQGEAERRPKAEKKGRSEDPSDLPYENLPFHGLRDPPKKVLNPVNNDYLEYADADYAALYAEGPIGYKAASMQRALVKRQKMGLEGGARL